MDRLVLASHASLKGDYESADAVYESVKRYYGKVLCCSADLKTSACCTAGRPPGWLRSILSRVPEEIMSKYYGCGTPLHTGIDGLHVLDLGSGSGRDCYVAAALVGPTGSVTGVDMTVEQLDVSRRHADSYCKNDLQYPTTNLRFVQGFIEYLDRAGIADSSIDLVISNCVVNLSPSKARVLSEVFRVLRNGGEFFFSDVFCDRRLPQSVRENELLLGECIGGALYVNDFLELCSGVGFADPRRVSIRPIAVENEELAAIVGNARFFSIEWRLFKIAGLEPNCEDYGQSAVYRGGILGSTALYRLDDKHTFEAGRPERVCGNTALMLANTWLGKYFAVHGDTDVHFGSFPCAPTLAARNDESNSAPAPSSCC
eukprot:ANDGO_05750.mRNA.1 Putative arsenite methyltransferase